jgi:hypothetical protein
VKDEKPRKTDPPLHLDMEFGEALARFAQTKPEEVEPPKGKKRKKGDRRPLFTPLSAISPDERDKRE